MHDFSLYLLDLIENSLRAEATKIAIFITQDPEQDTLTIALEDNGTGLAISPSIATSPFFTTKEKKTTGLGLSLLRADVEQADGLLIFARSKLGGLGVKAIMRLGHIDRLPLGNIGDTLATVVCTNPGLDLSFGCRISGQEFDVNVSEIVKETSGKDSCNIEVARKLSERIEKNMKKLGAQE